MDTMSVYMLRGQTGTGKNFTIEGADEACGVSFSTLEELFTLSRRGSINFGMIYL